MAASFLPVLCKEHYMYQGSKPGFVTSTSMCRISLTPVAVAILFKGPCHSLTRITTIAPNTCLVYIKIECSLLGGNLLRKESPLAMVWCSEFNNGYGLKKTLPITAPIGRNKYTRWAMCELRCPSFPTVQLGPRLLCGERCPLGSSMCRKTE